MGEIPLGNGEFCFNADGTGLQTLGGVTMSHWGWHSVPLPDGWTADRVPPTGTFQKGRNKGFDNFPPGTDAIRNWMRANPHILNLGRLRLCKAGGEALKPADISGLVRKMDLWSGVQTSSYQVNGEPVRVETCVHPTFDAVVVRIESPLITRGELQLVLDFPGPMGRQAEMTRTGESRFDLLRVVDATKYYVGLSWSSGGSLTESGDHYGLSAKGARQLELVCAFSSKEVAGPLPTAARSFAETVKHWGDFWSTGGAIDLSGSKDPRWVELEHPDPVGVVGMLPPTKDVDFDTAHRTALKVWRTWQWDKTWGWDFSWMAMAAARTGEPQMAIEALLKESPRNRYDQRGVNIGGGPGGYLPGNGGLLYAVALMAAGWDGCPDKPAPGFPSDGSWTVKWEKLKKAP